MAKHVSEFHAYLKPPMQIKATKQDSIKCINTREKTAFTCSKAIGELTSELEKLKIKTQLVLILNSQVRNMGWLCLIRYNIQSSYLSRISRIYVEKFQLSVLKLNKNLWSFIEL